MSQSNTGPGWDVIDDALTEAGALKNRIANIHTARTCPKCGARVGERCYSLRPSFCATPAYTKHPHIERYRDLVR